MAIETGFGIEKSLQVLGDVGGVGMNGPSNQVRVAILTGYSTMC
jgi:ribosomal protein S28E/S33